MTERQAWLYMARLWDNPLPSLLFNGEVHVICGTLDCQGLCRVIGCLYRGYHISHEVYQRMDEKMRRIISKRRKWGSYIWKQNEAGARCRARFCRKMASECGRVARSGSDASRCA